MKTGIFAPLTITMLFLLSSSCRTYVHTQTTPTKTVTVEALDDDISYNLDLRAVATVFANSRDLQDFEYRLNDYDSGISNLDLNGDGQVDYLRVVEMYENGVHLVVIQSVLGQNVFQDVATVVVETKGSNKVHVQIVGDPFIYGVNYIIEPVFYQPPVIYTCFRVPHYVAWRSPYYWGHYPHYYHHRAPARTNVYINNVHIHINNHNSYKYTNRVHNQRVVNRMQTTVSRSDYARSNPRQSFNSRNNQARNSRDLQVNSSRSSTGSRSNATVNSSRSNSSGRTSGTSTNSNNRQSTNNSRSNVESTRSSSSSSRQTTTQPNSSRTNSRQETKKEATAPSTSSSSSRQTTTKPSTSSRTSTTSGSRQSTSSSRQTGTSKSSSTSSNRSSGTSTRQSNTNSSRSSGSSSTVRSSGSSSSSRSSAGTSSSSSRSSDSGSSSSSRSSGTRR